MSDNQNKTEFKSTVNLPKTDFSMKANLPQKEPKIMEKWAAIDLYGSIRKIRNGKEKYILHDGPPYSNGDIHMGHALNKILKDIIVKYYSMKGFDSPYVPGWDNHGLPVEHQLFKDLKMTKYDISQVEFRKKAADYAKKYVDIQRKQFERLGILGDWANPYLTLSKNYEAEIVRSFGKLAKKGFIFKDRKPVNWCYRCETALAEAEVEYDNHTSNSVYVKFKAEEFPGIPNALSKSDLGKTYFIIWTTTPWTLLANVAIALHPDLDYAIVETGDEKWIILESRVEAVFSKIGKEYKIIGKDKGRFFDGSIASHPFIDRKSKVVYAPYVTSEDGTGCVHTAPGHGMDDYITGKKFNLPIIMPVDGKGKFDNTSGEFSGLNVHKADELIIHKMIDNKSLVISEKINHSYPHCWRCKSPIIFRATEQWFMGVDKNDLRRSLLNEIKNNVRWVPEAGASRISSMVELRPDWCLSRQRYWGVAIPIFYCKSCNEPLMDGDIIEHVAILMEQEGADVWFIKDAKDLLPPGIKCSKCQNSEFTKENDILDVWFDSGVSHQAVLKRRPELKYPADLYLEGSDQHRGWFQSSLITAMGIEGRSSYKTVLTHGFVVDGTGKKMSKSLGNVISPLEVMKSYGADILRLWVASSDYSEDVRISPEILERIADSYRKIRNTYKYILGNIYDFDFSKDAVPLEKMTEIDLWALRELSELAQEVDRAYDGFQFHKVYSSAYNFCIVKLSNIYLDILKDRLYTFRNTSLERRSAQTALYYILTYLCKLTAPILCFTSDEAFESLTKDSKGSIHLELWPDIDILSKNVRSVFSEDKLENWNKLFYIRENVLKALEIKRGGGLIGSGLEAKVEIISLDKSVNKLLETYKADLAAIFITSQVDIVKPDEEVLKVDDIKLSVGVKKADGIKCQRCWNFDLKTGSDASYPTLCPKCIDAVK